MHMKKAILVVSFGTTKDETREKNIAAIEREIQDQFPEDTVRRAFTSGTVIHRLAQRGIQVDAVDQALERLRREKFEDVFILPTHLLPGEEYEKLLSLSAPYRASFRHFLVAKPLLYDTRDLTEVAEYIKETYPMGEREALVLMGHGTGHFANLIYPAMDYILKNHGMSNAFVATVEGYPEFPDVLNTVKAEKFTSVTLLPLMLVAGEHAMVDMAGQDEHSWKNQCARAGMQVTCVLSGLGESDRIRKMYLRHLQECMKIGSNG